MSRARNLGNLGNENLISGDTANLRVGINSTLPTTKLDVDGNITATAFFGDGSNLEGVASAGLGTALSDDGAGSVIYFTNTTLGIGSTVVVDPPSTTKIAYTQYSDISLDENVDFIVEDGDDFVPDVLGLSTEGISELTGIGGRIRAGSFTDKAGTGAPKLTFGAEVPVGVAVTGAGGINVAGFATAGGFVGNLTGNTSGTAGGLTGTPDITIRNITGVAATFTGVLTYEDVTNVDSVGIVTARGGLEVGAAGVGGTITPQGNAIFVGVTTVGTGLTLADNVRAKFGNSGDLAVYHNGSHGYVENQVDGQDLNLISTKDIYLKTGDGASGTHTILYGADNAGIELRYDNVKKFETTIEGTITTGIATVTAIDGGISAWVLGANGTNHYTFTGPGNLSATDDPQIELQRGQTYVFRNRSGGHPFRIQSTVNGSTGTQYSTGVTNNDGGDGTDIIFDVPFDAPNILYYQCTSHGNMGGVMLIGERGIPANTQTGAYVLIADDAGKTIYISTGGVTINNSLFSEGDAVTIINNSASTQTITQGSGVTLYDTGDDGSTGNKTLKARGMCTVWFASASVGYISGNF